MATRILIAEDQLSVRVFFKKLLEPLGAEIIEAGDGREALALAVRERFDVIITDFEMPRLNGAELCRQLRGNSVTQGVPVVMVSTFDSDPDIDRGFEAGASHYLSKRRAETSLLATVRQALAKSRFQSNKLILVVDDSPVVRRLVEAGLLEAGFQVFTAEDGKQALHLLSGRKPDLILCDIEMPRLNGFALCQALHAEPSWREIPFVVMSIHTDRGHMRRMMEYGAVSFISKPFNLDQLVILVEKLLSDQYLLLLKEKERLDVERTMLLASITSLISALEVRDPYTKGHSEAVAEILTGMLTFAGADRQEIEAAALGGRLHDIGKIGIRDEVLLKPGPLTRDELAHIKAHPELGAGILKAIPSLEEVLPIVLHHHERPDGKGYPHGLRDKAIPAWARAAAVADTYNALTSNRSYRRALPQEEALQILIDVRGTQLCPDYVDLFLQWIGSTESSGLLPPEAIKVEGLP
ncbi:MAG: response regulator [Desulfobacteraceae bacterium]|nr:response regulator [Desulfobacteraceae bacterium]